MCGELKVICLLEGVEKNGMTVFTAQIEIDDVTYFARYWQVGDRLKLRRVLKYTSGYRIYSDTYGRLTAELIGVPRPESGKEVGAHIINRCLGRTVEFIAAFRKAVGVLVEYGILDVITAPKQFTFDRRGELLHWRHVAGGNQPDDMSFSGFVEYMGVELPVSVMAAFVRSHSRGVATDNMRLM